MRTKDAKADYSEFTIVISTLNEGKNIGLLLRELKKEYKNVNMIVVDDGSTDNTSSVVTALSSKKSNVVFYDRKKKGLPSGLTHSMICGLMLAKSKYVIFMDGDLQHPPSTIALMAKKLDEGNELVIAVREGSYNKILHRHLISAASTAAGSAVLNIRNKELSRDIFSGYFGIDRKYAQRIVNKERKRFVGEGYKFLFDLLKCIDKGEASIAEVPYKLERRREGSSKAKMKHGIALIKSFVT